MPKISSVDAVTESSAQNSTVLTNPHPSTPFSLIGNAQFYAMYLLSVIFTGVTTPDTAKRNTLTFTA